MTMRLNFIKFQPKKENFVKEKLSQKVKQNFGHKQCQLLISGFKIVDS